jgi:hypothetical protein
LAIRIDVGNFIRQAIAEKIQKDYKYLIPKPKKIDSPF